MDFDDHNIIEGQCCKEKNWTGWLPHDNLTNRNWGICNQKAFQFEKTFQGTYSVRFLSFHCNQFAKIGRYIKRDIYWITSRININIKETVFRQIQFKAFSFSSNSVKRISFRLLVTFSSLQTFAADIFSDALLLYLQGPKE